MSAEQRLLSHAKRLGDTHLRDLTSCRNRFAECSRTAVDVLVDFSRQILDKDVLSELVQLAHDHDLEKWKDRLFCGADVNNTENRAALHMALRADEGDVYEHDSQNAVDDVLKERNRMLGFAEDVRNGQITGLGKQRFRSIVNIGIGGSDLGVAMASTALAAWKSPDLDLYFVSGIDGVQLDDVIKQVNPQETLFVVCSKTMTTAETLVNALRARDWVKDRLGESAIGQHFAAVSVNVEAMDDFGIPKNNRFKVWDWVGGRFSVWSSMGMVLAIAIGADCFGEFLAGAREMDHHYRDADIPDNLPAILGLIDIWNIDYRGVQHQVVLPYDSRLGRLPDYLQQLFMESLGKSVTREGAKVDGRTGAGLWGQVGSNAQHAFLQLLHQGTLDFSVDFVAPARGSAGSNAPGLAALTQCIAQREALARGHDDENPHLVHPGNHPSTLILVPRTDPYHLGALLALYEHRVFTQACIWEINPFDQFGVELGKRLARELDEALAAAEPRKVLPPGIGEYVGQYGVRDES